MPGLVSPEIHAMIYDENSPGGEGCATRRAEAGYSAALEV